MPLAAQARLPSNSLLILACAAALMRRGTPAWAAAGAGAAAAAAAGLPDASLMRIETWCAGAAILAGTLILWRATPPLPVFFLNLFLLAVTAFSPAGSPPAVLPALAVLAWMAALEAAYLPPGVAIELRASLLSMLRLAAPVGGMVVFFSLMLPGRDDIESVSGFTGAGILEAGAFGRVRLSAQPAFRAHFDEPVAPRNLYWRGDVLEENA
ncbi:MAG: DUF3488 domain-containing protein, partial [Terrimicrobiaceae bacterium]|nr:DUF3488 domain-containing protein [Terrimicrobiaceae bacterium]